MKRTLKDINQEFANNCAQLGELQYKVDEEFPYRIIKIKSILAALQQEALAIQVPVVIKEKEQDNVQEK